MAPVFNARQRLSQRIVLTDGQLLRINRAAGWRISVADGVALLTSFNELQEHELSKGHAIVLGDRHLTLVEAIGNSVVLLEPPPAALICWTGVPTFASGFIHLAGSIATGLRYRNAKGVHPPAAVSAPGRIVRESAGPR